MAVNVHLTFYNHFGDRKLRSMEIPYILLCYGIPFIPALTLLFIRNDGDLPYGDATLWCWLTPDWDLYRIVLFYAPVCLPPGFAIEDFEEIHNTLSAYSITIDATEVPSSVQTVPLEPGNHTPAVVVAADPNLGNLHHLMPHVIRHWPRRHSRATTSERLHAHDANKAAWSYAKCAILFFAAMLITWIPSSANRVYSFIHKNRTSAPLEFMSAFVLPLQGFWNFFIYAVFSWRAFKELWEDFKSSSRFFTGGGTERVQLWKGVSIHPVDIRGGHADSATELATHGAS
ncbi:G-protein coupled receptor protein [Ceratocystis lukuohia]|uniref:G-protein coupled receptor protein n=1 Tax=Ceratocystis lukuohia TaxID=2019550 RepID=A0ABR4MIX0_9PEZI